MNIRKITSLTMLISFLLCILTSVVLYIVPHGRVAYWANWKLWGLTKTQWAELHINLGILLLLAGSLHIYYNWGPITTYIKSKSKRIKIFTMNFNIALLLTLIVGFGTFFHIPPMSTIVNISESIKDAASTKYGEPPYGHAELSSLKRFTRLVGLDLAKSIELLHKAGIKVENEKQTINDIAVKNNITPKQVFDVIKPASQTPPPGTLSAVSNLPPPGFGKKKLEHVCTDFGLDLSKLQTVLSKKGISANPDQSIKEIAAENNIQPIDIFVMIKDTINNP